MRYLINNKIRVISFKAKKYLFIVIDVLIVLTTFFAAWYWFQASTPPIELSSHWDSEITYLRFNDAMKYSSELNSRAAKLSGFSAFLIGMKSVLEILSD